MRGGQRNKGKGSGCGGRTKLGKTGRKTKTGRGHKGEQQKRRGWAVSAGWYTTILFGLGILAWIHDCKFGRGIHLSTGMESTTKNQAYEGSSDSRGVGNESRVQWDTVGRLLPHRCILGVCGRSRYLCNSVGRLLRPQCSVGVSARCDRLSCRIKSTEGKTRRNKRTRSRAERAEDTGKKIG